MSWSPKSLVAARPIAPGNDNPSDELVAVYGRIEAGMAWLVEHDPTGSFHLWFESALTPLAPMPAQAPERRADWSAYHGARSLWERLWRKMVSLEKKEANRD